MCNTSAGMWNLQGVHSQCAHLTICKFQNKDRYIKMSVQSSYTNSLIYSFFFLSSFLSSICFSFLPSFLCLFDSSFLSVFLSFLLFLSLLCHLCKQSCYFVVYSWILLGRRKFLCKMKCLYPKWILYNFVQHPHWRSYLLCPSLKPLKPIVIVVHVLSVIFETL